MSLLGIPSPPRKCRGLSLSCPDYIAKYASYLKERYRRLSVFPDRSEWPPSVGKFDTQVVLIEQQYPQSSRVSAEDMSDIVVGGVERISARKKKITVEEIFTPSETTGKELKILIDGAPGVGKTTLTRRFVKEWAEGKLLSMYDFVLLLPLRDRRIAQASSISELFYHDDSEVSKQVSTHVCTTMGTNIMLILDGFDELSLSQRKEGRLILNIIHGEALMHCSVIVTSRPVASEMIQKSHCLTRHVEVLGFTEQQIQHCITSSYLDAKQAQTLIQMLQERQDLISLCYIPLNCAIMIFIYKYQSFTLPDTITQLYEMFLVNVLKRHADKYDAILGKRVRNLDRLPDSLQACLTALSKLAFTSLENDQSTFYVEEIEAELSELPSIAPDGDLPSKLLGLMNVFQSTTGAGIEESYQFLHRTIQEFLAAKYVSCLPPNDQVRFFKKHIKTSSIVAVFQAGLTKLSDPAYQQYFEDEVSFTLVVKEESDESPDFYFECESYHKGNAFLQYLHALHEAQNIELCRVLPKCVPSQKIGIRYVFLSPFHCRVLAYCLINSGCCWNRLDLKGCNLTDSYLQAFGNVQPPEMNSGSVKELIFHDLFCSTCSPTENVFTFNGLSLIASIPLFQRVEVLKLQASCLIPRNHDVDGLSKLLQMRSLTSLYFHPILHMHYKKRHGCDERELVPCKLLEHPINVSPSLQTLSLAIPETSDCTTIESIALSLKESNVNSLELCSRNCSGGIGVMFPSFLSMTAIQTLSLVLNRLHPPRKCSWWMEQHFHISSSDIQLLTELEGLQMMLDTNETLKCLELHIDCMIEADFQHLAKGLSVNKSLTSLSVSGNQFPTLSSFADFYPVFEALQKKRNLEKLHIVAFDSIFDQTTGLPALQEALRLNVCLQSLTLEGLKERELRYIFDGLINHHVLNNVELLVDDVLQVASVLGLRVLQSCSALQCFTLDAFGLTASSSSVQDNTTDDHLNIRRDNGCSDVGELFGTLLQGQLLRLSIDFFSHPSKSNPICLPNTRLITEGICSNLSAQYPFLRSSGFAKLVFYYDHIIALFAFEAVTCAADQDPSLLPMHWESVDHVASFENIRTFQEERHLRAKNNAGKVRQWTAFIGVRIMNGYKKVDFLFEVVEGECWAEHLAPGESYSDKDETPRINIFYVTNYPPARSLTCPDYVARYASYLKEQYRRLSVFSDGSEWPPLVGNFETQIILIEHQQYLQNFHVAAADMSDIVMGGKKIPVKEIFAPSDTTGNELKILIDGAPGVGKTTLTRRFVKDWAEGKLLSMYDLVLLLPLREKRIAQAKETSDLFYHDDAELREQIVKHVCTTMGANIMLILDGFDELSLSQRKEGPLILNIIHGEALMHCSVIVTSRPVASEMMQKLHCLTRHVEVLGFTEKQIQHCITSSHLDAKQAQTLVQMLQERQDLISLCYIPLNCAIMIFIYKYQSFTLPDTITQLYEMFLVNVLKRHVDKYDAILGKRVQNLNRLPDSLQACLTVLSKLAFTSLENDQSTFYVEEIETELSEITCIAPDGDLSSKLLGLMNVFQSTTGAGREESYQFLHRTIQEFLAAKYACGLPANDQVRFFKKHIETSSIVAVFQAGLTKLSDPAYQQYFEDEVSLVKEKSEESFDFRYKGQTFLQYLHAVFEAQNNELCRVLPKFVPSQKIDMNFVRLSPFHCRVLAYCLINSGCCWNQLDIKECNLTDSCLQAFGNVQPPETHCGSVKDVIFSKDPVSVTDHKYTLYSPTDNVFTFAGLSLISSIPLFRQVQLLKLTALCLIPNNACVSRDGFAKLLQMKNLTCLVFHPISYKNFVLEREFLPCKLLEHPVIVSPSLKSLNMIIPETSDSTAMENIAISLKESNVNNLKLCVRNCSGGIAVMFPSFQSMRTIQTLSLVLKRLHPPSICASRVEQHFSNSSLDIDVPINELEGLQAMLESGTVKHLEMFIDSMTVTDVQCLARGLSVNKCLISLTISSGSEGALTFDDFYPVYKALKQKGNLEKLHITASCSNNPIDQTAEGRLHVLGEALRSNNHLVDLTLEGVGDNEVKCISNGLINHAALKRATVIGDLMLQTPSVAGLLRALQSCPPLQGLVIRSGLTAWVQNDATGGGHWDISGCSAVGEMIGPLLQNQFLVLTFDFFSYLLKVFKLLRRSQVDPEWLPDARLLIECLCNNISAHYHFLKDNGFVKPFFVYGDHNIVIALFEFEAVTSDATDPDPSLLPIRWESMNSAASFERIKMRLQEQCPFVGEDYGKVRRWIAYIGIRIKMGSNKVDLLLKIVEGECLMVPLDSPASHPQSIMKVTETLAGPGNKDSSPNSEIFTIHRIA